MADLPEGDGFTWVGNNRREGEGHPREGQEGQVEEEQSAGSGGMRGDNHAARITFQSPIVQSSPATRSAYDSTMQPLRPHLRNLVVPPVHQQLGFVDAPISPPEARPSAESGEAEAGVGADEVGEAQRRHAANVKMDWAQLLREHSAGDASGKLSKDCMFSALEAVARSGGSALVDSDQDFDSIWLAVAGDGSGVPTLADAAELLSLAEAELARVGEDDDVSRQEGAALSLAPNAAVPAGISQCADASRGKRLGHLDKLSNEVQELERYLVQSEWGMSHISLESRSQRMLDSRAQSSSSSPSPARGAAGGMPSGGEKGGNRGGMSSESASPARGGSITASLSPGLSRTPFLDASATPSPASSIVEDSQMFDGVTVRRDCRREGGGGGATSAAGSSGKAVAGGEGHAGIEYAPVQEERVEEGDSFTRSPVAIIVPTPTKLPNAVQLHHVASDLSVSGEGGDVDPALPTAGGATSRDEQGDAVKSRLLRGEGVDVPSSKAGNQDEDVGAAEGGRGGDGSADTGAARMGGGMGSTEQVSRAGRRDGAQLGKSASASRSPLSADRFRRYMPPIDKLEGKAVGASPAASMGTGGGGSGGEGAMDKGSIRREGGRGNDAGGDASVGGAGDLDKKGVLKRLADRTATADDEGGRGRGRESVMQRIAQRAAPRPQVAQQHQKQNQQRQTAVAASARAGAEAEAGARGVTPMSNVATHDAEEGGAEDGENAYSELAFSAALDRIMRGLDDVVTCVSMTGRQEDDESGQGGLALPGASAHGSLPGRAAASHVDASITRRAGARSPLFLGSKGRGVPLLLGSKGRGVYQLGQAGDACGGYAMSERNPRCETGLEAGVVRGGMHPAFLPSSPPRAQYRGLRTGASLPSLKTPWLAGGSGWGLEGEGAPTEPGHSANGVARVGRDHGQEEEIEDEDDLSTPRQRSAPQPIEAHHLVHEAVEAGLGSAGGGVLAASSTKVQSRVSKTPSPIAPGKRLLLSSFTSPGKRGLTCGSAGGAGAAGGGGGGDSERHVMHGVPSMLLRAQQQRRQLQVRGRAVVGGRARDIGSQVYHSGRGKAVKASTDTGGRGGSMEALQWAATAKRVRTQAELMMASSVAAAAPYSIALSTSPPSCNAPPCPRPMPRPGSGVGWGTHEGTEDGDGASRAGRRDVRRGDFAVVPVACGPDDLPSPSCDVDVDGGCWPFGGGMRACDDAVGAMEAGVRGLLDGACGDDAAAVWADIALGGSRASAWRRWRLDHIRAVVSSEVARVSSAAEGECRRVRELEDEVGDETRRLQQMTQGELTLESRRDDAVRRGEEAATRRPFRSPHKIGSKSKCPIEEASQAARRGMHWHEDGVDMAAARSRGLVKLSLMRDLINKHVAKMCMLAMRSCVVRRHAARKGATAGEVQGGDVVYLRWGWAALRGRAERMRRVGEVEAAMERRRCAALSRQCLFGWGMEARRRVHFREIVGDFVRRGNRRGVRTAVEAWKGWGVRQTVLRARLEAHVEGVSLESRQGSVVVCMSEGGDQEEEEQVEEEDDKEGVGVGGRVTHVLPRGRLAVASAAAEAMLGRARSRGGQGTGSRGGWSDDDDDDKGGSEGGEGFGSSACSSGDEDSLDGVRSKGKSGKKSSIGGAAKAAEKWSGGTHGGADVGQVEAGMDAASETRRGAARDVSRTTAASRVASSSSARAGGGGVSQGENRSSMRALTSEGREGASKTRERSRSRGSGHAWSETGSSIRGRSRGVSQTRERGRGVSQTRQMGRDVLQTGERGDKAVASGSRTGKRIEKGVATRICASSGEGCKTTSGSGSATSVSRASCISSASIMSAAGVIDGDAARRALVRLKSFRAWVDAVSRRRADLKEVIEVGELYERQLMLRCWSSMWLFAREASMSREAARQTARARRQGEVKMAMSQWRGVVGNRRLLRRVFETCEACWDERERLEGEEGDFEALWGAIVSWKKEATAERQHRQAQVRAKAAHIFSRLRLGSRCMHAWHVRTSVCRGAAGIFARGLVRCLRQCLSSWAIWTSKVAEVRCRWDAKVRMGPAVRAWRAITFLGRAADERAAACVLRRWRDANEQRQYEVPALHRDGALLASGLVGLKGTISRKANKAVAAMHAQAMLGRHFLGAWSDEVRWDARLRWLKCQAEAHNLRASLVRALLCWSWNAKRRRMGGAGMAVAVLHRVGVVCRGMLRMWRHRAARARRERECKEEGERGGEGGGEEEEGEEAKEDGGLQEDDIARGGAGGDFMPQAVGSVGRRVTYGGEGAEEEVWGGERMGGGAKGGSRVTAQMSPIHALPATPMPMQPGNGHAAPLSFTGPAMTIPPSFAGGTRTRGGKGGLGSITIVDRRPSAIRSEKEAAAMATARMRSQRAASSSKTVQGHSEFPPSEVLSGQGIDEAWGMSSSGSSSLFDKENVDFVEGGEMQGDERQAVKSVRPREVGVRSGRKVASLMSRPPEGVELRMGGDVGMHIYPPLNPVVHANHVVVGAMFDGTLRSRRAAIPLPGSPQKTWRGDVTLDL